MSAKRILRSGVFVVADILGLNVALLLAYVIRFDLNPYAIPEAFLQALPLAALVSTIVKLLVFWAFRLYKSLWRYAGAYEVINVTAASFCSNGLLLVLLFAQYHLTGELSVPRSIFPVTFLIDVFAVGGVRLLYRSYRRYVTGTTVPLDKVRRVLIIGAGDAGVIMAKEMRNHPEHYKRPIGFLDPDPYKHNRKINGLPIYGGIEETGRIVSGRNVQEIIIALPGANADLLNAVYAACAKTGCKIRILPSVGQLLDGSVVMQKLKDVDIEDLLGREPVMLDTTEISDYLKDKVILITGAGGSIGSELCRQIAGYAPTRMIMLDNYENGLFEVEQELLQRFPNMLLKPVVASIRDKRRMQEVFMKERPQIVFHAAAHKHVPLMETNPSEAIKNNVIGTWIVANCALEACAERFLLISSDKAVNPTNVMGATKRIAEMILTALNGTSGTEFVAVRFGNVLGSNGSVIPLFKKQIAAGGPLRVTHRDVTRFFMTIPEAVQLVLQAGGMAKGGEIFILDMGQPIRIYDLAENLIRLSGYRPHEEIQIDIVGLRPGEKLYEELMLAEEGTEKTKNTKIHIAKPAKMDYNLVSQLVKKMETGLDDMDEEGIRTEISNIVPNYRRQERGQ